MSASDVLDLDRRGALTFETPVPRSLVHKRAVEQVFVTDAAPAGADDYLVAAQLPRAHALFNDSALAAYDLMLLAEVVRQAAELVAHLFLEVPQARPFVFRGIDLEVEDFDALRIGREPSDATVALTVTRHRYVGGELAAIELSCVLQVVGRRLASGSGACLFLDPKDYAELRGDRTAVVAAKGPDNTTRRVAAARVGRRDPFNVLLAEAPGEAAAGPRFALVIDQTHPTYFDHPQDHVPGMVLLEACRQAAIATGAEAADASPAAMLLTACRAAFTGFAELDDEVLVDASVSATQGDATEVAVQIEQAGRGLCSAAATVSRLTDPSWQR